MSGGFDVVAGAAGFASLGLTLLQGCIQGFVLLSTAQNLGQDADVARCELEFQQYRLSCWAEKAVLKSGTPSPNLNWEIINDLLTQLRSLVSETETIRKEYRLELITTEDRLSVEDLKIPRKGLRRMMARCRPEFYNQTARTLQEGTTIWKRLKWAVIDKDGIGLLVSDIRHLVDNLWGLLQNSDQDFIRNGMELLLRQAISQATEATDLANIKLLLDPKQSDGSQFQDSAVSMALELKNSSIIHGFSSDCPSSAKETTVGAPPSRNLTDTTLVASPSSLNRNPLSSRSRPIGKALSYKLLNRHKFSEQDSHVRELASYDKEPVLLEWKVVEHGMESKMKHRIKTLAALLQNIDSISFHTLACKGFLKDSVTGNYGYVFRPPAGAPSDSFTTLKCMLSLRNWAPSLNDRIRLSVAMMETVLQLHTAGWLHKGVRPDNILFFQDTAGMRELGNAYLEGYEYARADNPSDMTESPESQQEANLYRHPSLLRANRATFCKEFDLFALGCVLIEVGLWENLSSILLHFLRDDDVRASPRIPLVALRSFGETEIKAVNKAKCKLISEGGIRSIEQALEFAAGKVFASVVRSCLLAGEESRRRDEDKDEDGDEDDDEGDRCIDLEYGLLRRLKGCSV